MKEIAEPDVDVSGNGSEAPTVAATPQASTTQRTLVIVLAEVIVLAALIMIWRARLARRKQA